MIPFDPLGVPAIAGNPPDRCYHCKKALAPLLKREAAARGLGTVVDGVNCSDLAEHRPGLAACAEEGIAHPYRRRGDREAGDPGDRPVPRPLLRGEAVRGLPRVPRPVRRAPHAGPAGEGRGGRGGAPRGSGSARAGSGPTAGSPGSRCRSPTSTVPCEQAPDLVAALKAAGFAYVTLDLEGYRSGAMDEVLGVRPK